ncbi:S-adenosylmethionine:tRNA ribosyltransferase-isomerase [Bordetella trematum]|nr:S-adenosylmethionine:tRNA ribosyltransferase-isomerase [Bordetella trematum]
MAALCSSGVYNTGLSRRLATATLSNPCNGLGPQLPVSTLSLSDFDYVLPPELIAQAPAAERGGSRLLHLDAGGALHDRRFPDLAGLLRPHDLLVFNDTRVIKARLTGQKATGGKVEVLVERITEPTRALAHVRASKSPGRGMRLELAGGAIVAEVLGREGSCSICAFPARCWRCWTPMAPRPCPLTSPMPPRPRMTSAIRPSMPASRARWLRPRPGCISMSPCWSGWPPRAWRAPSSPCTWALAPSSRCGSKTSPNM